VCPLNERVILKEMKGLGYPGLLTETLSGQCM
jgi:hypothetical protein